MLHTDARAPSARDHSNPMIAVTLQIIFKVSIISNCSFVLVNKDVIPIAAKAAPTNLASTGVISVKPNRDRIHVGAIIKGRAKRRSTIKCILNQIFKLLGISFFMLNRYLIAEVYIISEKYSLLTESKYMERFIKRWFFL